MAPSLSELCLMLRNGNPEAWDDFLRSFAGYTQEALEEMARAPADKVLIAQGGVQRCQALLRVFNECTAPSRKPAP